MTKTAAAISGGVDSAVCAHLLQQAGHEVHGVMLQMICKESSLDADDAQAVCDRLGIPFHLLDKTQAFKEKVMLPFAHIYESGGTPNPCVLCNKAVKFKYVLEFADENGFDKIATGHYVQTENQNGRTLLKRAQYLEKDQSYMLYTLDQKTLKRCIFPLGTYTKTQIRALAEDAGLAVSAKKDSQDICFVPNGKYAEVICRLTGKTYPPGRFVDESGRILGTHKGIINYTIGQRRGLGLALEQPIYVKCKDCAKNEVILAPESALYTKALDAEHVNFIAFDKLEQPLKCTAKTRYSQKEEEATVFQTGTDKIHVEFKNPQRAVTSGQSVVLYDGEYLLGGGTIL